MKKLTLLVLNRPVASILLFILLFASGILALLNTPVDFLPDIDIPQITVVTAFSGLPAKDIRELITIPLEDALSGLEGLKRIRSYSRDSSSLIQLTMEWGSSMDIAALKAREIIDVAYLSLPSQAEKPMVIPVNPAENPVIILGVFPVKNTDAALLRNLAEREVKSAVQQIKGVGSIQLSGGRDEFIEIEVDQSRLNRTGRNLSQVTDIIGAMNAEFPSGSIEEGDTRYIVKADGRRKNWQDFSQIILPEENGLAPIRIDDIASVERKLGKRKSFMLFGSQEGIALLIRRNQGYSPVALSRNVRKQIPVINSAYHNSLEIKILYDSSNDLSATIQRLAESALVGAAAAFIVLWFFLKKLNYAFVTLTTIPLSILGTVLGFRVLDISFNIMSLGGLTLGIGMLVDNSVVVLENIVYKVKNRDLLKIAAATAEITRSTIGSTFTSIIVFLPLFFLPGLLGEVFSDLVWAIILSLSFSLIISATWIPLLLIYSFRQNISIRQSSFQKKSIIRKCLRVSMQRPAIIQGGGIALLVVGVLLIPGFKFSWFQSPRQSRVDVNVSFNPGTTVESIFGFAQGLSEQLQNQDGIKTVMATGGGNLKDPYFLANPNAQFESMRIITCIDNKIWTPEKLTGFVKEYFAGAGTSMIRGEYPPDMLSQILDVSDEYSKLFIPANSQKAAMQKTRELLSGMKNPNVQIIPYDKKPQFRLVPDRQALAHYGITLSPLASLVGTAVNGQIAGNFEEEGIPVPVRVRLRESDRSDLKALASLKIMIDGNKPLLLEDLVQIESHDEYPVLYRENRRDVVYLVVPRGKAENWVKRSNGLIVNPEAAQTDAQKKSFLLLFGLAVSLLYVLLGVQFESYILPLLLLLIQPFAIVGALLILRLGTNSLSLNSLLGILVVLGLSINNAILLYEEYQKRIRAGFSAAVAVYSGTIRRIRPILITGFTTIIALCPIAFDFSGKNPQSSLALAVIGGLFLSIPVAVFYLPVVFRKTLRTVQASE